MPVMLKQRWTRAIWIASFSFPFEAKAARRLVVVVPIFDPKVSGYARSSDTKPAPARGVRVLVKTLLDWTMIVSPAPTTITRYPVTQPKYLTGISLLTPFFMISLTFSPSKELRILTRPMRQPHNISRETVRSITPAAVSPISAPSGPRFAKRKVQPWDLLPHPVFITVDVFSYLGSFLAQPSSTFLFTWITDLVKGFVKTFRKSGGLEEACVSPRLLTIALVMNCKYPVQTSTMTRMMTESQLNMSWTVAQAKALLNSSLSDI